MARDNNGNWVSPVTLTPNTTARATDVMAAVTDLGGEIADSLSRSGKGGMQADLDMGDHRISNVSPGTANNDVATLGQITPVGAVIDFAGNTAPSRWLLCYGQEISRTTYAALFEVIGTTFGAGNGSTTFKIPDLRGRVSAGVEAMGGVAAGRIGGTVTGSMASVALGGVGGEAYHSLTSAELPTITPSGSVSATATASAPTATLTGNNGGAVNGALGGFAQTNSGNNQTLTAPVSAPTVSVTASLSMNSFGGNGQHNNIQPTMMLNKIIYAGV